MSLRIEINERGFADAIVDSLGVEGTITIGSSLPYARIQQEGGEIALAAQSRLVNFTVNRRTGQTRFARASRANFQQAITFGARAIEIPARPYLGLSQQDVTEIGAIIGRAAVSGQRREATLKQIGEYVVGETKGRFRDERAPDGTPWKPLSRRTLKRKQKRGKILKILQQDGFLRNSIVYRVE